MNPFTLARMALSVIIVIVASGVLVRITQLLGWRRSFLSPNPTSAFIYIVAGLVLRHVQLFWLNWAAVVRPDLRLLIQNLGTFALLPTMFGVVYFAYLLFYLRVDAEGNPQNPKVIDQTDAD